MHWLYVFVGGGIGSLCRYGISQLMPFSSKVFPFATFITNFMASILIGILVAYMIKNQDLYLKHLLITGFCGGFSTFSAFSLESYQLIDQGAFLWAILYILVSVLICLAGVYLGLKFFS